MPEAYRLRAYRSTRAAQAARELFELDQRTSRHLGGLLDTHQSENRRSHVGQYAVLDSGYPIGYHDDRHGIERVRRIGRTVFVDGIVGIAVVGYLHDIVAVGARASTTSPTHSSTALTAFCMAS